MPHRKTSVRCAVADSPDQQGPGRDAGVTTVVVCGHPGGNQQPRDERDGPRPGSASRVRPSVAQRPGTGRLSEAQTAQHCAEVLDALDTGALLLARDLTVVYANARWA